MFEVYLKGQQNSLTFDGLCNYINYDNPKVCIFKSISDDEKRSYILAAIPYENIEYIACTPYHKAE